jgi:hypothetical protein
MRPRSQKAEERIASVALAVILTVVITALIFAATKNFGLAFIP